MNPESQIPQPSPESACGCSVPPQSVQESGCGILPQTVQGASRSESTAQDPEKSSSNLLPPLLTDHRSLGTSSSPSYDMGFVYPPEMPAEPDYDGDCDYEDDARERELMLDDLADDNDGSFKPNNFFLVASTE
jgi:hypothetical protein